MSLVQKVRSQFLLSKDFEIHGFLILFRCGCSAKSLWGGSENQTRYSWSFCKP
jgi:hypothetical protein